MEPSIKYDIPAVIRRRKPSPVRPQAKLLDLNWQYVPAAETDIRNTFRRMGWVPPTEVRNPNGVNRVNPPISGDICMT